MTQPPVKSPPPEQERLPLRVVMLLNYIPLHFMSAMNLLAARVERLTFLLSVTMESSRDWNPEFGELEVKVQKSISLPVKHQHPFGFDYPSKLLIPVSTWSDLRHLRPDVVVSLEVGPRTLQAFFLRWLGLRYKLVVQVRESEITAMSRGRLRIMLRKFILPRVDQVLVNGESGRRHVRDCGVRDGNITLVPSGTDTVHFGGNAITKSDSPELKLLYVGALIPLKGIIPFAKILRDEAARSKRRIRWQVIGRGPDEAELQAIDWPPNCIFEMGGACKYHELPQVYAANDVFVMPSLADEWGMVVNEAMASGLPVLGCTGTQAVEELVKPGENGWIYQPGDEAGLRQALREMLDTEPTTLLAMGHAARRVALECSDRLTAERILEALQKVMNPAQTRFPLS
jgi:glycosyltransferase involved in cell wall biosynthesis